MAEPLADDAILGDIEALSVRVRNVLDHRGLVTVAQVRAMSDRDLLRLPHIGRKALAEIRAVLEGRDPPQRSRTADFRCCPTCGRPW